MNFVLTRTSTKPVLVAPVVKPDPLRSCNLLDLHTAREITEPRIAHIVPMYFQSIDQKLPRQGTASPTFQALGKFHGVWRTYKKFTETKHSD